MFLMAKYDRFILTENQYFQVQQLPFKQNPNRHIDKFVYNDYNHSSFWLQLHILPQGYIHK